MSDNKSEGHIPTELTKLGDFVWPQGETRQTLTHLFDKLREKLPWRSGDGAMSDQKLHPIKERDLMDAAHQHLGDLLNDCLDATYKNWMDDPDGDRGLRAFVHSPMPMDQLDLWAKRHNIKVIETLEDLSALNSEDRAVVPQLGGFLHRRKDKLHHLREVLAQLATKEAKIIVGCNSWSWRYAVSVSSVDTIVAECHTTPAFDDLALAALLEKVISKHHDTQLYVSEETQEPVFQRGKNGKLDDPYFTKLAKCSFGLPWVAIEMFFDGLSVEDEVDNKSEDRRTWLHLPASHRVPAEDNKLVPVALQNLLIHEPCSKAKLEEILPDTLPPGLWTALQNAGFIQCDGDSLRHSPSHYPAIRSFIGSAGLNLDRL